MYAIVEFLNSDFESTGEISIVPLIWIHKNEKKCYWPIRTNRTPFQQFVQDMTPFKKSWPSYKVKIHFKSSSYVSAEQRLTDILAETVESSDSKRSLCQKQIECELDSESTDDSSSETSLPHSKTVHIAIETPKRPRIDSSPYMSKNSKTAHKTIETPKRPRIDSSPHKSTNGISEERRGIFSHRQRLNITTPTISISSNSESNQIAHSSEFENVVLNTLSKIAATVEQHSIMLHEINQRTITSTTSKLIPPGNIPQNFPIQTKESFQEFEVLLSTDSAVWEYMVKRLAALGGSGAESLTRRILKYLISNEVAVLYNWKGRDKLAFEKLKVMELIMAAVRVSYASELNELKISNTVKDWLKYSKLRMSSGKKKCLENIL